MWARQTLTGTTLRNADTFLEQNANAFPTIAGSGARRKLRRALASLNAHAEDQARNSLVAKGTTQKYRALRVALMRDHMSPIAGIALAALADAPEVAKLRMPRGRPSTQRLALAATAMRSAAEPFSDAFVAAGLAPDFLVQLTAAADAMMDALGQRAQTLGRRAGATRGVEEQLRQGRQAIAALDRILTSILKDHPALLANWKMLKRVRQATGSGRAVLLAVAPTTAAV